MNLSEDTTIRLSFKTFSLAIKTVGNLIISMKCRPNEIPTSSSLSTSSAAAAAAAASNALVTASHLRKQSVEWRQSEHLLLSPSATATAYIPTHLNKTLTPGQCRPTNCLPLRLNSKLNMAISLFFCHKHSKYKIKKY